MITEHIKGNKRQEGETFQQYRDRIRFEGDAVKRWGRGEGRVVWDSKNKGTALRYEGD